MNAKPIISDYESRKPKQPFFIMDIEQIRLDYKEKLINAETYVYYLIKAHRSAGWKWTFSVKEFCKEWDIKERTFYHAVSRLRSKKLIEWQTEGRITVWWGADIAKTDPGLSENPPNPVPASSPQTFAEPVQEVAEEAQPLAVEVQNIAMEAQPLAVEAQTFAETTPETLALQSVKNATDMTDIKQISTDICLISVDTEQEKASLTREELLHHAELAREGVKPTPEVIAQLREDSGLWVQFLGYIQLHGWQLQDDLSPLSLENPAKMVVEQLKARRKGYRPPA